MTLARLLRSLTRLRRIQPQVGRAHAMMLRRARGRLRRSRLLAGGQPVLALTTTGRRSGRPRSTVVAYLEHRGGYAAGGLNLGSDHDPAWALNLRSDPHGWVELDGQRRRVRARLASGIEAQELWQRFIERLPQIANALRLAAREVPMFVLEPVGSGPRPGA